MDPLTEVHLHELSRIECEIDPDTCIRLTDANSEPDRVQIIGHDQFKHVRAFNILSPTNLTRLPAFIFTHFPKMLTLRVHNAGIESLDTEPSGRDHPLEELNMQDNRIATLPKTVFLRFPHLTAVDLSNNQIRTIDAGVFQHLFKLRSLDLSNNALTAIDSQAFHGAHNLRDLCLDSNALETVADDAFELPNLEYLSLKHNRLGPRLSDKIFEHLCALEQLDLSENNIEALGATLNHCRRVYTLNVSHNDGLKAVNILELTQTLPKLSYLYLANIAFDVSAQADPADIGFHESALSRPNRSLTHLDLSSNGLSGDNILAMLRPFEGLKTVILDENGFAHLNLEGLETLRHAFPRLKQLSLLSNPVENAAEASAILEKQFIQLCADQ